MTSPPETDCPRCGTLFVPSGSDANEPCRCPACGETVFVDTDAEDQAYELWEGDQAQPGRNETWAHGPFLPVVCKVCGTRMYGRPEQAGTELTCPDCRTKTLVPQELFSPAAPPAAVAEDDDPYELEEAAPVAASSPYADVFSFACPNCGSLLYASPDRVGEEVHCPDCRKPRRVPPPPARSATSPEVAGPTDEGHPLEVAPSESVPSPVDSPPPATVRYAEEDAVERVPEGALAAGVRSFLLDGSVWLYWLALATTGAIVAAIATAGWGLASQESVAAVMGVFILVAGVVIIPIWFCWFAACVLTVVVDSSFGYRKIVRWPEGGFTDWFGEAIFVAASLLAGFGPGVLLTTVLGLEGIWAVVLIALLGWMLWPIVTLSMLDAGTPLKPFVPEIVRGIEAQPTVWMRYYMASAGLFAAGATVCTPATFNPLVSLPVLLTVALLEFRLLGLVAWACSDIELGEDADDPPETDDEEDEI